MRWTTVGWVAVAAWVGHAAWTSDAWTLYRAENRAARLEAEARSWARLAARGPVCFEDGGGRYGVSRETCPEDDEATRRGAAQSALATARLAAAARDEADRLRAARHR